MAIYLGGVVAGVSCEALVLRTTFAEDAAARAAAVRVWGFRGPVGAWVCIWGAAAMITSAPLDDWWHNAYGLDVQILSPPHTLLALGIGAIGVGALLMAVALQNRAADAGQSADGAATLVARRARLLPIYAAGFLLTAAMVMATEFTNVIRQHHPIFYQVVGGVVPLYLLAMARASRLRWGATATAAAYMAIMMLQGWILPLFAAQPRLGPIFHPVSHMVPMSFPLLLVVPALAIDLVRQRLDRDELRGVRAWGVALATGAAFLVALLAVQWGFSGFLLSQRSYNWFFFGDNFNYGLGPQSFRMRGLYLPSPTGLALVRGLLVALVLATLSSRLGLAWGGWMRRVRR
jgi:hypothetical protein